MIQLSSLFFSFSVNDWKVNTIDMFESFYLSEELYGVLPIFKLEIKTKNIESYANNIKYWAKLQVKIGISKTEFTKYYFRIINYNISKKGDYFQIELSGILDLEGFLFYKKQFAKKCNLLEFIKDFENIKTDIKEASNDKQYWIQYNTTENYFYNENILHTNIENRTLITGITLSNKLKVSSVEKENIKEKFSFENKNGYIVYNNINIKEDNYLYFKRNKSYVVTDIKTQENLLIENTNIMDVSKHLINTKNTFEKFYEAKLNNIEKISNLLSEKITLDVGGIIWNELEIGDKVKILYENLNFKKESIIYKKEINIQKESFSTKLHCLGTT